MKRIIAFAIFFSWTVHLFPQQQLLANHGDTIRLQPGAFDGELQWQSSWDQEKWESVTGGGPELLEVIVDRFPIYYRAVISQAYCQPHFSETISVFDLHTQPPMFWSDPDTWGTNGKPQEGDEVIIPADRRIIVDESPPPLRGIRVEGKLEFDRKDLQLTSDWILISGVLEIGKEDQPYAHKAIVTINGSDTEQDIMGMGTRGIMVMSGGSLELHGTPSALTWTKLNDHAMQGATEIVLKDEVVDWKCGDEIVIAPTDYYLAGNGSSVTLKLAIADVEGATVLLSDVLNANRWGKLQYATLDGMSLSPSNLVIPPADDTDSTTTPRILDERAEVANLTRNIVLEAPNDDLWRNDGFGMHIMIMKEGSARVEGVEIRRGGQAGRLRRYPFHWHMLSYEGEQTLEDAEGQYFKNSAINQSMNRGVVIHGTNGVLVQNNIIYDVRGHGIFMENAVERRNIIDGNLVMHVRNPDYGLQLMQHEIGEDGSSGYWLSNPDNIITNNRAIDCQSFGFWLSYPVRPWGESSEVMHPDGFLLRPNRLQFGTFDRNVSHSNRKDGIMFDKVQISEEGDLADIQYLSTSDDREPGWPWHTLRRFALSRYETWKNGDNGIWDRSALVDNFEVVSADNCGRFFAGSGAQGVIERSLVVATSLNHLMNNTDRLVKADFQGEFNTSSPAAFATYHSTFDIQDNVVIGFEAVENTRSGVFSTDDYYLRPVEKGQVRNTSNLLINSHPGVKLKAPFDYFTLASALWDPYGLWGPEGNYLVYDDTFLTYGKEVTQIHPVGGAGGVSVAGPFYGFYRFVLHGVGNDPPRNQPFMDLMGIHVQRLDDDFNEVATWTVAPALTSYAFNHMRDFATSPDGYYVLTFPGETSYPTDFQMTVENMLDGDDVQMMAIQFDGNLDPIVVMSVSQFNDTYQRLDSRDAVIQSDGATFWQDKSNNLVWVKIKGGVWEFWTNDPEIDTPTEDELLYEPTELRIYVPN
jgi:hypothetical protein